MAVVAYWPLNDPAGARYAVSGIGGAPLQARVHVGAGITPAAEFSPFAWRRGTLHQWLPPCLQAESGGDLQGGKLVNGLMARAGVAGEWALDFLYRATAQPGNDEDVALNSEFFLRQTDGIEWVLAFKPGTGQGEADVTAFDANGGFLGGGSALTGSLHDGNIKYVRLVVVDGGGGQGNWLLRVDTAIVGSGIVQLGAPLQAPQRFEAFWFQDSVQSPPRVLPFHLGQVVVWDNAPDSVFDVEAIILGHRGETPMERIRRLCQEDGIPFTGFGSPAIHEHSTTLGPQQTDTFLGILREAERTSAGGVLHELAGGLAYSTVEQRYNQTPALEFDIATEPRLSEPPEPIDDDLLLVNKLTVTQEITGEVKRVDDDASIAESGAQPADIRVNLSGPEQLNGIAGWLLAIGLSTRDAYRWPALELDLARNPELIPAWLDFRLGGRAQVSGMFTDQLPGHLVDVVAEGWSEAVRSLGSGRVQWQITLNTVPASPYIIGQRLGVGDTPGPADPVRRDTAGSQLSAQFVSGTDTTMSVETTQGPLWAVSGASNLHLPLDVHVAGARVRVTAIGAAVGQVQTFTVDAAVVNGVNKTIPAGEPVRLWQPAVRGL